MTRNRLIIWDTGQQPDHLHFQRYARDEIDAQLLVTGQGLRFAMQMATYTPAGGSAVLIAGGTRPPKPPIAKAIQQGGTWAFAIDHAHIQTSLAEVLIAIHEEEPAFRLRAYASSLLITTAEAAKRILNEMIGLEAMEPLRGVKYTDIDRISSALLNAGLPDSEILPAPG